MTTVEALLKTCTLASAVLVLLSPGQARELDMIPGAKAALPTIFTLMPHGTQAPRIRMLRSLPSSASATASSGSVEPRWSMPLTDRTLTQAERSVPLAADLQEAINRIEPIFDPTRMNAFQDVFELRISPGSAFMADVFGEHWHLAADDPNVHLKVRAIGLAWLRVGERSCDQFSKTRPHEIGEAVLTALSQSDCHRLMSRRSQDFDDAVPVPIASVPTSVPVFAAPLPGARMSSSDFWAAQKARIEAVRARLQRRWGTLRSPAAH